MRWRRKRRVLLENRELVTKREDLCLQRATGSKTGGYQSEKGDCGICAGPAVPPMLFEHLDEGLRGAPPSEAEALVREDVAAINVRAFEKLRQEREASPH